MRGSGERSGALFSYVDMEARVPAGHPLRMIRAIVNEASAGLWPRFQEFYARIGRPSIRPEQLLRPLLLQAF
jgi:transposase